jgi:hypothetical protein
MTFFYGFLCGVWAQAIITLAVALYRMDKEYR